MSEWERERTEQTEERGSAFADFPPFPPFGPAPPWRNCRKERSLTNAEKRPPDAAEATPDGRHV